MKRLIIALTSVIALTSCAVAGADVPQAPSGTLVIRSHADGQVVSTELIDVEGTAPPGAEVVHDRFFAPDHRTTADDRGHWAIEAELDVGDNELTFRIGNDRHSAVTVLVVYEPDASDYQTSAPRARPSNASTSSRQPTQRPEPTPAFGLEPTGPTETGRVVNIVDGDTIDVVVDGVEMRVRYIGMDTPEVHSGVEWLGPEAAAANAELVEGREVVLERDVSETDQYGRALRYVWVADGSGWMLVNLELIRLGFASITTYPPDVKYVDALYVDAQDEAQAAGLGLWGAAPTPPPTPAPTPVPPVAAPVPLVPQTGCEASYPGICIPIGSADLDCGEIQWRRFAVVWNVPNPDPHGFDGDQDGIGCES
jgi:micrococcal nuclease